MLFKTKLTKGALALATIGALGAGSFLAAAPASAAPQPRVAETTYSLAGESHMTPIDFRPNSSAYVDRRTVTLDIAGGAKFKLPTQSKLSMWQSVNGGAFNKVVDDWDARTCKLSLSDTRLTCTMNAGHYFAPANEYQYRPTVIVPAGAKLGDTYTLSGTMGTFASHPSKVVVMQDMKVTTPAAGSVIAPSGTEFTGVGTPGTTVVIKTANGTVVGSGLVDAQGNWTAIITGTLPYGTSALTFDDDIKPVNGSYIVEEPVVEIADLVVTAPAAGSTIDKENVVFTGTAEPGATVVITDAQGNVLGQGIADGQGNWSATVAGPLAEGTHDLTFTAGEKTAQGSYLVVEDEDSEGVPAIDPLYAGIAGAALLAGAAVFGIRRRVNA